MPVRFESQCSINQAEIPRALGALTDESIDAVITDPPYGIGFMGHEWDQPGKHQGIRRNRANGGQWDRPNRSGPADRGSVVAGSYDRSVEANRLFQSWCETWALECLRILKPGAHLLAFGGPRTSHRVLRCELEANHKEDCGTDVNDKWRSWPKPPLKTPQKRNARALRRSEMPRGKRIKGVSDKQKVREAYLTGIKAERISHALLVEGSVSCSHCPKRFTSSGAAHAGLDMHHTDKRSRGQGYRPGNAGVDAPAKLELACRACHRELEANEPMWSAKESA